MDSKTLQGIIAIVFLYYLCAVKGVIQIITKKGGLYTVQSFDGVPRRHYGYSRAPEEETHTSWYE